VGLSCLLCSTSVASQNLIKNPSFEEFVACPKALGTLNDDVVHWSTPTEGSTDYFNACSRAMGTPKNFNGSQPADFGVGYAGLYLYAPNDYREYLQAELTQTLVKGKKYRVSFYVSLAERSDFAVKEFGVLFSKERMQFEGKKELSGKKRYSKKGNSYNYMEIGYSNFYSDTKDWVLVYTQFEAKGNERFMTLGNFKNNPRTRLFKTKRNAKQGAYYYVDMVLVEAVENNSLAKNTKTSFELEKIHVFQNVLFEFDKFTVQKSSRGEIERLHAYLKKDTTLTIAINGHTDSVGSNHYNKRLSTKRAAAVADLLYDLGIAKSRIIWQGHGGEKPIASNDTEKGRQQNRRVEFVISRASL
jgi:outer membrane protein OmpA-like peptidoglycan-associated protein